MSAEKLHGKTALVTGASRGIGKEIARRLAADGAIVAVHYNSHREGAQETLREIQAAGGKAFIVRADLATTDMLGQMFVDIDAGLAALGVEGLDILVNNAGVGGAGDIATTDEAFFDHMLGVNLKAPFFVTQHALRRMRDGGSIINITSVVSLVAYPGILPYATAKAGLNHFTRSLAKGLGSRKIRVNAVAPGATNTDFGGGANALPEVAKNSIALTALGRVGDPEDIGGLVAFLASSDGSWITGQIIGCNGGMLL